MKLKLKSKIKKVIWLNMWEKMDEGWIVIQLPKKNIFGTWTCKLEK